MKYWPRSEALHQTVSFSYEYQLATISLWLLGFHSILLFNFWLPLGFPLLEAKGLKVEAKARNIFLKYTSLDQRFTFNSLVFVRILFSDHKPLASWLPYNSIVLPLASAWLPIVRSQRFESGGQGMKISMKMNEIFSESVLASIRDFQF